jgi:hypothetical protein
MPDYKQGKINTFRCKTDDTLKCMLVVLHTIMCKNGKTNMILLKTIIGIYFNMLMIGIRMYLCMYLCMFVCVCVCVRVYNTAEGKGFEPCIRR